jgi:hypothetical protein
VAILDQAQRFRAAFERQLSAVADLKTSGLAQWRQDHLADATVFFRNPSFAALVRRCLEQPADAAAQRQLQDWLGQYPTLMDYNQVGLLEAQGVTRWSFPAGQPPLSSEVSQRAAELLRSGQMAFQDFYRQEANQRISLAVLVPLFEAQAARRPLGVLVLRIDPGIFLYPFVKLKQLLTFVRGTPGARVPVSGQHLLRDMGQIIQKTFPCAIRPRVAAAAELWPLLADEHPSLVQLHADAHRGPAGGAGGRAGRGLRHHPRHHQSAAANRCHPARGRRADHGGGRRSKQGCLKLPSEEAPVPGPGPLGRTGATKDSPMRPPRGRPNFRAKARRCFCRYEPREIRVLPVQGQAHAHRGDLRSAA